MLSFLRNPAFSPAWQTPLLFKAWSSANLLRTHHFQQRNTFKSFSSLRETHSLPASEIFRYLQLQHFYAPYATTTNRPD
ncbi:unnamed protein product, partial [Staurois parvus]